MTTEQTTEVIDLQAMVENKPMPFRRLVHVPTPEEQMGEVLNSGEYIDQKRLGRDDYRFAHQAEYLHYQNWRNRRWVPACRKAGFAVEVEEGGKKRWKPTVRVHDLRHTFASMRAAEGVPPHVLKEWLGHASITTTMDVYTHVYQDDPRMEAIIERLYTAEPVLGARTSTDALEAKHPS